MTDFLSVYNRYFRDVYRYALALSGSELLAEEITQETFFRALTHLDTFDGRNKVFVWLCRIAKNVYLSMRRKAKRFDWETDIMSLPSDADIEEIYSDADMARSIRRQMDRLEDPYREVFALRTLGDFSFRQIGELLGKSENWARVTYHRARMKIKEELL